VEGDLKGFAMVGKSFPPVHDRLDRLAAHWQPTCVRAKAVGASGRAGQRGHQHKMLRHNPTLLREAVARSTLEGLQ
jgi:hypothetical protein